MFKANGLPVKQTYCPFGFGRQISLQSAAGHVSGTTSSKNPKMFPNMIHHYSIDSVFLVSTYARKVTTLSFSFKVTT